MFVNIQSKLFELRTLYQRTQIPQIELQYLNELELFNDQIVTDYKQMLSHQLKRLPDLTTFQIYFNKKLDAELKQGFLDLNLSELYFRNILVPGLSMHTSELIRLKSLQNLQKTKLDISISGMVSEETLKNYCEIFKESALILYEYQIKKNRCKERLYLNYAEYHSFHSDIAYRFDRRQDSISHSEQSVSYLEQSLKLLQLMTESQNTDEQAYASRCMKDRKMFLARTFQHLGHLVYKLSVLNNAQKYLFQAAEIQFQLFGPHSMEYLTSYFQAANRYHSVNLDKYTELIQYIYDTLEYSHNKEVQLQVSIEYFMMLLEFQEEAQHIYVKIVKLLSSNIIISDNDLLFKVSQYIQQFHCLSISYRIKNQSQGQSEYHVNQALQISQEFPDIRQRSICVTNVVEEIYKNNSISEEDRSILYCSCLKILEEQQQYRIEILKDEGIENRVLQSLLFSIEGQILRMKFFLYRFHITTSDIPIELQKFIYHFKKVPMKHWSLLHRLDEYYQNLILFGCQEQATELLAEIDEVSKLREIEKSKNSFNRQSNN